MPWWEFFCPRVRLGARPRPTDGWHASDKKVPRRRGFAIRYHVPHGHQRAPPPLPRGRHTAAPTRRVGKDTIYACSPSNGLAGWPNSLFTISELSVFSFWTVDALEPRKGQKETCMLALSAQAAMTWSTVLRPIHWNARTVSCMSADAGNEPSSREEIAAMLAAADAARAQQAEAMLGSAAFSDYGPQDEEPDWVRARMEQEEQTFRAKRDSARAARAEAWLDEERALRAAEAAAMLGGAAEDQVAQERVAEYEARVRAKRTKTPEEKRAEYAQDQIRQIAEADAMDERLARRQREARELDE